MKKFKSCENLWKELACWTKKKLRKICIVMKREDYFKFSQRGRRWCAAHTHIKVISYGVLIMEVTRSKNALFTTTNRLLLSDTNKYSTANLKLWECQKRLKDQDTRLCPTVLNISSQWLTYFCWILVLLKVTTIRSSKRSNAGSTHRQSISLQCTIQCKTFLTTGVTIRNTETGESLKLYINLSYNNWTHRGHQSE